ncbi:MAG: hypothetical protein KGS73_19585 [Chloroflexi bacterium]|nr:hypothetical protein [Chloroflexota bacterium]
MFGVEGDGHFVVFVAALSFVFVPEMSDQWVELCGIIDPQFWPGTLPVFQIGVLLRLSGHARIRFLFAPVKPPLYVVFSAFHPNPCINGQRHIDIEQAHLSVQLVENVRQTHCTPAVEETVQIFGVGRGDWCFGGGDWCFSNVTRRVCIETIGFFKVALSFFYFLTDLCNDFIYLAAYVCFDQDPPPVVSCCAVWVDLCRWDVGLLGQPFYLFFFIDQVSEQLPQLG